MSDTPTSLYEAIGGEETMRRIVHGFYLQVPEDDILGPMYPEDDMKGAEERLFWFLSQFWGGPRTYSEQRGHPRLRQRHFPFEINQAAADRWFSLMSTSVEQIEESTMPRTYKDQFLTQMRRTAQMLINQSETPWPV